MKKIREKRYGVFGLTEWQVMIPAGRATARIHFTGGSQTGHGLVPATFATDNEALQALIEQSPQFKSGRIVIV